MYKGQIKQVFYKEQTHGARIWVMADNKEVMTTWVTTKEQCDKETRRLAGVYSNDYGKRAEIIDNPGYDDTGRG